MSVPGLVLQPYMVSVTWGEFLHHHVQVVYFAKSPAQARARAYQHWLSCNEGTFLNFMKMSRARKTKPADDFGAPITVEGRPAFFLKHDGHYISFCYPGSDQVLLSHPLDVRFVEKEAA